jgi:hypothetical protein
MARVPGSALTRRFASFLGERLAEALADRLEDDAPGMGRHGFGRHK